MNHVTVRALSNPKGEYMINAIWLNLDPHELACAVAAVQIDRRQGARP
jgi:hypothetical protein